MRENRASHLGQMKNSSYYIAPVGDRTHDLPHTVASNMVKVSHALTHSGSATAAFISHSMDRQGSAGTLKNDIKKQSLASGRPSVRRSLPCDLHLAPVTSGS